MTSQPALAKAEEIRVSSTQTENPVDHTGMFLIEVKIKASTEVWNLWRKKPYKAEGCKKITISWQIPNTIL